MLRQILMKIAKRNVENSLNTFGPGMSGEELLWRKQETIDLIGEHKDLLTQDELLVYLKHSYKAMNDKLTKLNYELEELTKAEDEEPMTLNNTNMGIGWTQGYIDENGDKQNVKSEETK